MSKESTARRDSSIPRKVSLPLRREDSGYNSVIGTPAGTPCVMSSRRTSRVGETRETLKGIPESSSDDHYQEVTTGSFPAANFTQLSSSCLPHEASSNHQLQEQLSVPDEFEERTSRSAPMACLDFVTPVFNRAISLETGYYMNRLSGGPTVSEKAEEIISKFENFRMDSTETVHTQSPSPVEQHEEEDNTIQYPVPEVSQPTPPAMKLQRQFSEFPLDETVLTRGQDGYYLEDRDYDIVREAGAGGSACCNLGNDRMKKNQFIIKRPKKSFSDEEKQDMMRESRILKEINHDNVIRFYGAVEDLQEHCFKIFLEYADETCGDINYLFCESADKESFSGNIALIMLYVQQMLFAVDYLHWTRGILHLDIKGKNIVVCNGGYRVKLIDFGTACKANDALPQKTGWTPVFAAPEVNNQSQPPKFSADIWSVMCVAVEMVTEDLPWPKETNHQTAVYKIGCYEDDQITELVQYDEYWDKYSYYSDHQEMYEELVHMWKIVFRKDSSSRPSANELLHQKWMKKMEIDGESILHDLTSGEEEQPTEQSQSVEDENIGIVINHPSADYSHSYNEDSMSGHCYGRNSPYHSTSPHLSLSQVYPPSGNHSPTGSDSEAYYDCNSSFSGRNDAYLSEPQFIQPTGPSSLPTLGAYQHPAMINATSYSYQSSTPMMAAAAPQLTFAMDRSRDFTDSSRNEDSSSSSRGRSRSFSIQDKRPNVEQVTGKRRTSLCYIGSSKSDPVNVLNATGIMGNVNKANIKRVNSLIYVSEGPKPDSPVSTEQQSLQSMVPGTANIVQVSSQLSRLSSSDTGTPVSSLTSSVVDSGYGQSFEEQFIKRSVSADHTTSRSSRLSLPDRDEHKPDGCSEPSETIPHTIQLSSPTGNKPQQIEVHGSTTVKELLKMTQHSKQSDGFILKLDSTTVQTH